MSPTPLEPQSGTGDEVSHNARNENFAGLRLVHDTGGSMDGDTPHVAAAQLNLPSVKPGTHRRTYVSRGKTESQSASDGATGAIKRCEETVAGCLYELSAMPLYNLLAKAIVLVEQTTPALVTQLHGASGRSRDIREHDGRQNAIDI